VREFADIDLPTRGTRFRVECVQHPAVVVGDPHRAAADDRGPFAGTVAVHRGVIAAPASMLIARVPSLHGT